MYLAIKKLISRYSGTFCMKIHLFKIAECLVHYICSYIICISNNLFKSSMCSSLKSKIKNFSSHLLCETLTYKYNGKNDSNLKFIFGTRLEVTRTYYSHLDLVH